MRISTWTSCSTGTVIAVYSYDASSVGNFGKGLRTGMVDLSGSASYAYDRRGQVSQETKTIASATNPTKGLVARWALDEGLGGTAADGSGGNYTLTLTNSPSWGAGKQANAIVFDGVNDRLQGVAPVIPAGAKTIAFWIKRTGLPTAPSDYQVLGDAATSSEWGTKVSLDYATQKPKFELFKGTAGTPNGALTANTAIAADTWTHIAITWDGTTTSNAVKLYINGTQDATGTAAATEATAGTRNLWIGSLDANKGHVGSLDDIRVYNRALTSTEVGNLAGTAEGFTTSYFYDNAGRMKNIAYPTGEIVTQTYNGRGLPYSLSGTTAGSLVTSTVYSQVGPTQMDLNNGVVSTYEYWGLEHDGGSAASFGRLYESKSVKSGTTLQQLQHTWDVGGNLTSRVNQVGTAATESFAYDFLDRLTGVSNAYTESYAYNQIGNMSSKNGNSYTYGDTNHKHAVTAAAGTSYAYDANGNMSTRGSQTFTWSAENRVTAVTRSCTTATTNGCSRPGRARR